MRLRDIRKGRSQSRLRPRPHQSSTPSANGAKSRNRNGGRTPSNGAGKTTFARAFLPEIGIEEFLNADLLASGLTPLNPAASAFAAGRLLLQRWHALAKQKASFGFETTLSGQTYAAMLTAARDIGYTVEIHFLWVPQVSICLRRVRNRVRKGGHSVPETDVRRRYPASIRNFFSLYLPLAHEATLWDVSGEPPQVIANWEKSRRDACRDLRENVFVKSE